MEEQKTNKIEILKSYGVDHRIFGLVILLALAGSELNGQMFERLDWPVEVEGKTLEIPWTGGLDAPQFSQADLDFDGDLDILIFDRVGDVCVVLASHKAQGDSLGYTFAPELVDRFPKVLQQWAQLQDFNGDNIVDLFGRTVHPGIHGVDVYRGRNIEGVLNFERMRFDFGTEDYIYFLTNQIYTALYASWLDVSVIEDIDGDGDVDILSFDPGGSSVYYYKNTSLEKGLGLDTLIYDFEDNCWGKFKEAPINQDISLSNDPDQCASGNAPPIQPRHSGSTLAVFDSDNDGDFEMLIGDIGSPHLIYLTNGGTAENAYMVDQEARFPAGDDFVDIALFPSAFNVDVNQDGRMDLICSTNEEGFSENLEVVWYYENVGSASIPEFAFRQKDQFISEMLDFGSSSRPAFVDYNADGLLDIVVGTAGFYNNGNRDPRLILLENVGAAQAPSYRLVDEDYLGFSAFGANPTWDFAPSFGDLDGDGDADLLVGEQNGQLFFAENLAGEGAELEFEEIIYPYKNISVGTASTPCIYDVNGDGLMDIVIGERVGNNSQSQRCSNMNYFQNVGSHGNPDFISDPAIAPNTNCFGNILFNEIAALREYSAPSLVLTEDGLQIITGSEQGPIKRYQVGSDLYGSFDLVGDSLGLVKEGFRTAPALADLNGDGFYEIVVGNLRGGLSIFQTDLKKMNTSVSETEYYDVGLEVFPNPIQDQLTVVFPEAFKRAVADISVISSIGQVVHSKKGMTSPAIISIDHLPAGMYWIQLQVGQSVSVVSVIRYD